MLEQAGALSLDLGLVVESLPFPAWAADADGRVYAVNRRWLDFTGASPDEPLGAGWLAAVAPDELDQTRSRFVDAFQAGSTQIFLTRLVCAPGESRWMRARAIPIRGPDGEVIQWLATWSDVDEEQRTAERLRVAAAANAALVLSDGIEEIFDALAGIIVPALADWCSLHRALADGTLEIVYARHRDPARTAAAEAMRGNIMRATYGNNYEAFRTGQPRVNVVESLDDLLMNMAAHGARREFVDAVRGMGYRSGIAVPLAHAGQVVGTLHVVRSEPATGTYDERDALLFTEIAATTAAAIVHASTHAALLESYEREHRVATVLQQEALPRSLPVVAGLRLDAHYAPGRTEAMIGGDWWDALELPDGRVVLSIGDVLGSGLDAAVTMSNLRQVLRGIAHVRPEPVTMLDAADRVLRADRPDSIATAFVVVVDPRAGRLTYASAGHPPALLRSADGRIVELHSGGVPLGLREEGADHTAEARFAPGSLLVLYTDGLTESTRDVLEGERRLRDAITRVDRSADHVARALYDAVLYDGPRDDVAILTAFAR
ncbi:MAG: SpoIIE family protein phosphatase [Candidatus Eremiobacteraeota bacterium]|nr:SpoIIE family protein phosphatase [Candidatus Eremiobacteraeota bacterium]